MPGSPPWCISRHAGLGQTHLPCWLEILEEHCEPQPIAVHLFQEALGAWGWVCRLRRTSPAAPLLIQPVLGAVLPAEELVRVEPECNLTVGALHGVAAMNHIPEREKRQ